MIRWIFKWLFRFFLLAVVLVVAFLLSLNTLLRIYIEHNIRAQTGMDAEIGRFKLGLAEPTIEIQDLKIYNPPGYGGVLFISIPEIHAEYDPGALVKKQLHLSLLRFNLAEIDIVKNQKGQTNIFALGSTTTAKKPGTVAAPNFKKQTGYEFKGIDALNVSFTKARYVDLQNQHNNREQVIGLQNCVVPNVKSANDLAGLIFLIDLRSNHFFDSLIAKPQNSALQSVLNLMGVAL
jgi:uncharacterized protein involved in outer membrane biogenesis